jgi:hypothetical protein
MRIDSDNRTYPVSPLITGWTKTLVLGYESPAIKRFKARYHPIKSRELALV